ncbi:heparan sulfate glucosamine 3-O-sulfotransferase 2-like [Clavelina lepadiformis]|uniref:heparan sulfate glucosamine 3-O-sulfotransferase 2-like n=1 Tax=Clavelina lepadiformis TaxID=159417 RepID=UPI0040439108
MRCRVVKTKTVLFVTIFLMFASMAISFSNIFSKTAFGTVTGQYEDALNVRQIGNLVYENIKHSSNDSDFLVKTGVNTVTPEHRTSAGSLLGYKHTYSETLQTRLKERELKIQEIIGFKQTHPGIKQLPKVIGIGVKKCGTDGVIRFLGHHPLIQIPWQVQSEVNFFGSRNVIRGRNAYRAYFPPTNRMELGMEKTPTYFNHPDLSIPLSIKNMVPMAKLLLIVCDPTMRSFSDYVHEKTRDDLFNRRLMAKYDTFEDYVKDQLPKARRLLKHIKNNRTSFKNDLITQSVLGQLLFKDPAAALIGTGLYIYHIQRWKKVYNESNLLIIDGENFRENTGHVIEQIQDFIGIPKLLWKEDFVKNPDTGFYCYRKLTEKYLNQSYVENEDEFRASLKCLPKGKGRTRNGAKHASPETLEMLRQFYKPYNEAFYDEIGRKYNWI